jgi:drug/metabolite transporter (DMT)-like permease
VDEVRKSKLFNLHNASAEVGAKRMSESTWVLAVLAALLSVIDTLCWGYCTREVGSPQLSLRFFFGLVFNKWFVAASIAGFVGALVNYVILKEMGVLVGRFFLSLNIVAMILTCTFVLGERPTTTEWIGIALILIGVLLLGRR